MWPRVRIRGGRGLVLVLALAGTGAAGAVYGPRLGRELDAFRVRRVEVTGTRLLDPHAVIRAAGLDRDASVLDDPSGWRAGVLTLPMVDSVRTRRTLPGTVTLEVFEVVPLALVTSTPLRAVDVEGRVVDMEPAGRRLDLPVLAGVTLAAGRVREDAGLGALAVLKRLGDEAPELGDRISQLRVETGTIRVIFRDGGPEALLPARPTSDQLAQLRTALADLAARGEMERARTVDVRFRDQVVVSFVQSPVS